MRVTQVEQAMSKCDKGKETVNILGQQRELLCLMPCFTTAEDEKVRKKTGQSSGCTE
jgi:hypothetical protein